MPPGITEAGLVEVGGVVEEHLDGELVGHGLDLAVDSEGGDGARRGGVDRRRVGEVLRRVEPGEIARGDKAKIERGMGGERLLEIAAIAGGVAGDGQRNSPAGRGGERIGIGGEEPGVGGRGPRHHVQGRSRRHLRRVGMRHGLRHGHAVGRVRRVGARRCDRKRPLVIARGNLALRAREGEENEERRSHKGEQKEKGDGFLGHAPRQTNFAGNPYRKAPRPGAGLAKSGLTAGTPRS